MEWPEELGPMPEPLEEYLHLNNRERLLVSDAAIAALIEREQRLVFIIYDLAVSAHALKERVERAEAKSENVGA